MAPFDWKIEGLTRDPVPVDAIPDIGENQQIIFTEWMGRSPQDVEDQITYPLTVALLGIPEVKSIRSNSLFGFSSIYIIFNEKADFYWSRTRVLEKLSSLPAGTLPDEVQPALGPDATPLGQVFWYTLEGRTEDGNPASGWGLEELRSIQDFYVRYALQSVEGVAEVASIGGFVKEYQVDIDPDAAYAYGVNLDEVINAVRHSNLDIGARTIEINKVEYVIRGLGFIESTKDLESVVVKVRDNTPITLAQVANISLGPALRRGALDKEGVEAVGGIVVARYGANPLAVIQRVKDKIKAITPGLPEVELSDGSKSKVTVVPFYDRTGLIYETLGTLDSALEQQVIITVIVVIVMIMHLTSSLVISLTLPLSIFATFIGMKVFGVDANVVALSGIAIAIGSIVAIGIIACENILKHLEASNEEKKKPLEAIYLGASEVAGPLLTAVLTTVVSFLPVFALEGPEGKLFKPLAYTKTFAIVAAIIIAITIIPALCHIFFRKKGSTGLEKKYAILLIAIALALPFFFSQVPFWLGIAIAICAAFSLFREKLSPQVQERLKGYFNYVIAFFMALLLTKVWLPLGPEKGLLNYVFVLGTTGALVALMLIIIKYYTTMLCWCLYNKMTFILIIAGVVFLGGGVWLGLDKVFGFMPDSVKKNTYWAYLSKKMPGLGKEFMPSLNEGSFLLMPTTMPHASIGEAMDVLQLQNKRIKNIPEIESVVGKIGRAESPLDPAPISMIETTIAYKPEYLVDKSGKRAKYKVDPRGQFERDEHGDLVSDGNGKPFRQWRDVIKNPNDIWDEIIKASTIPGVTSVPRLQPIEARIVMLQTGMRSPMGIKVFGPDLETIEKVSLDIEQMLKMVPSINPDSVFADRIVGKPYLEIDIDRGSIARYGMNIAQVQNIIEVAIGGKPLTKTVEGRERYPVRVRYMRELRDSIESIEDILIHGKNGVQIPLKQIAKINYVRGPQVIKSEETFLVGYVIFDKKPGFAEVEVVEKARELLLGMEEGGQLIIPDGVNYKFAGSYENQVRAEKKLAVILPVALFLIFIILYYQFKSVTNTLVIFSGIFVAWAGGFILIGLYGQDWFLNIDLFGVNVRDLFQIHKINLSVAVWVGFLSLFGIATDTGVIIGAHINNLYKKSDLSTIENIREVTIQAGLRRVRPAMMTTATTILALLPIFTSVGRGSDVMVPMAIPTFGGMFLSIATILIVPTLFCLSEEMQLRRRLKRHPNLNSNF